MFADHAFGNEYCVVEIDVTVVVDVGGVDLLLGEVFGVYHAVAYSDSVVEVCDIVPVGVACDELYSGDKFFQLIFVKIMTRSKENLLNILM